MISKNQSGFKPGDSCINQFLSITHEIYKSFDDPWEVRGVFLDISKVFDKVWHHGMILKLKQNGISGNLLKIYRKFTRLFADDTSLFQLFIIETHQPMN